MSINNKNRTHPAYSHSGSLSYGGCRKIYISLIFAFIFTFGMIGCSGNKTHNIKITIPAHSTAIITYSDEEISPTGSKICIYSGKGLGDTEVKLKPVEVREENAYDEATYLTPGMPIEMNVEKGGWFKIGVAMQNDSNIDSIVYLRVTGVNVRIE